MDTILSFLDYILNLPLILRILYWVIIILSIAGVLLENRNPVRSVSWILILIFIPYFGMLVYLVFGRTYNRQKRVSNKLKSKFISQTIENRQNNIQVNDNATVEKYSSLINLLNSNSEAQLFYNNHVHIFTDGKPLFDDMLKDIEKAENHVHAEYYIVETDETGNAFKDALIKKAQSGVEVRLIYDDLGSWRLKRATIKEMKKAGIKLHSFYKFRFPFFTNKLNYRNHRKILVIDGTIAYLGGFNIADRYTKGLDWGYWRDTHIRFAGNAVAGLQHMFLMDWLYVSNKFHQGDRFFQTEQSIGSCAMQIVGSGPDMQWQTIMQGFCYAIATAKKYVYIQTPYFLPNESISNAIISAALSGIEIKLMIPARSDAKVAYAASISYLKQFLLAGVKIYTYNNGFIHSKAMVIDDELSIIGSANMDFRSFEQNYELSAFIYDSSKALEVKSIFETDITHSSEYTFDTWQKRRWYSKVLQSIARLLSPAL